MKKIAVLSIATGKYIMFWERFFLSAEKHFAGKSRKEYFVFSDAHDVFASDNKRVHVTSQDYLGWPYDTLMRFQLFDRIRGQLAGFDYIAFFNANTVFVRPVMEELFLPNGKNDDGLVAVLSPGYFDKPKSTFPYEREKKRSEAYMNAQTGRYYFWGAVNGGLKDAYLELIETLKDRIQTDLDNDIIALWHDESHLNKYLSTRNPKILSPEYGYPEDWRLPFEPRIIVLDKNKYGGHAFLRNQKETVFQRIKSSRALKPLARIKRFLVG